jgi:hypothetical protein
MTFASKALESASERFFLVKMTARRYLYLGLESSPNTYVYTVPENLNIDSIIINGSIISSANYSYSNNQLQITSLLDLEDISNVVTLDHNIFLTGTKHRETVDVAGLPNAKWEPLISDYPTFSQSMANIAEGVFSLSNTDISFICTDRWAQALVGKPEEVTGQYESLSSSPVSVWVCIDDYANNKKIFDGEVIKANYKSGIFSVSVIDTFQKLTNSASFGTRAQSHIYTGNGTQYVNSEDENSAISITMGKSSPMVVSPGYKHVDSFGAAICPLYHLSGGKKAKLIGPQNADQSTSTTWMAGRVAASNVKRINFGSIVGNTLIYKQKREIKQNAAIYVIPTNDRYAQVVSHVLINHIIFVQLANINDFTGEIGDYIPGAYFPTGYQDLHGFVAGYGAGLYGVYNLAIATNETVIKLGGSVDWPNVTAPAMSLPNNTIPSMSVWINAGDTSDYTFDSEIEIGLGGSVTSIITDKSNFFTRYLPFTPLIGPSYTIGGQTVRQIQFSLSANTKVNLSTSDINFRISPNQTMTHGDAMKFIVKSSGMSTNDATFTQADADLAANVSVTFPQDESTEFSSYLNCVQAVTKSTLGLLTVNQDRQVEYKLIKNPESMALAGTRDPINMIEGQTQSQIEYQDLVSSVEFENPQLKNVNSQATAVVDFPIIKQVHRVEKTKNIQHVLESIQNRKDAIAGYFSNPTVEYSLATASEDLASSIGDVIEINNKAVADKAETTKGIIVSLNQSGSTTSIKVNETRGVD